MGWAGQHVCMRWLPGISGVKIWFWGQAAKTAPTVKNKRANAHAQSHVCGRTDGWPEQYTGRNIDVCARERQTLNASTWKKTRVWRAHWSRFHVHDSIFNLDTALQRACGKARTELPKNNSRASRMISPMAKRGDQACYWDTLKRSRCKHQTRVWKGCTCAHRIVLSTSFPTVSLILPPSSTSRPRCGWPGTTSNFELQVQSGKPQATKKAQGLFSFFFFMFGPPGTYPRVPLHIW